MYSRVPLLRPWHRSVTFWASLLGAVAILWTWIDSRYHHTQFSTGGSTGVWTWSNRSAIAIGFWSGQGTLCVPLEFRMKNRNPESFTWIRSLEVEHHDFRPGIGHTLYLPHYMLLPAWVVATGALLAIRELRKRRVLRELSDVSNKAVEGTAIAHQIESDSCAPPPHR